MKGGYPTNECTCGSSFSFQLFVSGTFTVDIGAVESVEESRRTSLILTVMSKCELS